MFKKLYGIVFWLLILSTSISSFATQIEEEEKDNRKRFCLIKYPNYKPEKKLILSTKIPNELYLTREFVSGNKTHAYIEGVFKEYGFSSLDLPRKNWNESSPYTEMILINKEHPSYPFLFIGHGSSCKIDNVLCFMHDSIGNWEYPRKIAYWTGKKGKASQFSWKYLDASIHYRLNVTYSSNATYLREDPLEKIIFETVNEKGLQDSFKRFLISFNGKQEKMFVHSLYDTNEEENTFCEELIKEAFINGKYNIREFNKKLNFTGPNEGYYCKIL